MLKKHQMPTSDSNSSRSEHVYFSPHFYTCQRLCVECLNGFINMASKAICFTVSCTVCPWLSISSLTSFRVPFISKMVMQNRYENILPHGCVSASFSTLSLLMHGLSDLCMEKATWYDHLYTLLKFPSHF